MTELKAHRTLISAEALLALMSESGSPRGTRVLDAGFDLADSSAGERAWAATHIPGSRYVHLDRDLSAAKTGTNGRHPLPTREAFAATAGRLGITPDTQVIALDRQGGMYAARLWWMLRWLGHDAVAVLDGGLAAWQAAGGHVILSTSGERRGERLGPEIALDANEGLVIAVRH